MNIEKLKRFRKGWNGGALPVVSGDIQVLIDILLEDDELDPPAKIDTTLRGWVFVTDSNGYSCVYWANRYGIHRDMNEDSLYEYDFGDLEEMGWTVRALTPEDIGYKVRRWDELTEVQRHEFFEARNSLAWHLNVKSGDLFNLVIDIATRGNA